MRTVGNTPCSSTDIHCELGCAMSNSHFRLPEFVHVFCQLPRRDAVEGQVTEFATILKFVLSNESENPLIVSSRPGSNSKPFWRGPILVHHPVESAHGRIRDTNAVVCAPCHELRIKDVVTHLAFA